MQERIPVGFSSPETSGGHRSVALVSGLLQTGPEIALRVVCSLDDFARVAGEWDEFLNRLDPVPLPLMSFWLSSWWKAFGQDRGMEMEFRCAYQGGRLVGIAPLVRHVQRHRGVPVTLLKLAANGHSPYSAIVVDSDMSAADRDVTFRLLSHVAPRELGLFFKIDQSSALKSFLLADASGFSERVGQKPSIRTPIVSIDQPWDDFYRSRPRTLKKSLNHKLNRFKNHAGLSVNAEPITRVDQRLVSELVTISSRSWKSTIGNDLGSNLKSRQFLLNLIEKLGPSGCITGWIARDRERPVAFELHLTFDGVVYPIRADYDQEYRAVSPGSVLEYTALKHLFDDGTCRQYYTCADDYWYLSHWATDYKDLCTIELYGDSVKLRALHFLEYRVIPKLKPFIKPLRSTGTGSGKHG
ncbi:GNAT family N-acetyltransferase [Marinobacter sp. chi1]|uniref:GNAT family N-acetyltransferase n=1 Tax=Marinobacter suaedae TaxID=3057675 RepID=A0ABT8W2J0_9GAMM|nr:GNAT family N-acetyltransferase [Marinobacter sp. chi1]MDO3722396.1 GNAT family N-acetyltransferase [Marinobacter sp. chi1]